MLFPVAKKDSKHAEVKMYGDIGRWSDIDAVKIKQFLDQLKAEGYEKVTFRVHSPGGSVFEGIAIKNAIIASGLEAEFVIEGIAASMMTQIMLAGKVKAYQDAKIMLHEAKSGVIGNAKRLRQEADLVEKITQDMAENYAQKTGKSREYILQNWLREGVDTWFSAQEAKQEGLIDEVIPANRLSVASNTASYDSLVACYNQEILNPFDMQKEEINALLGLLGEPEASSPTEALGVLKSKIEALVNENKSLKAEKEKQSIEALKAEMHEKGISTKQQEIFLELAKSNLQAVKNVIMEMPSQKVAIRNSPKPTETAEDRSTWKYADWERKDPEGLLELMKKDPVAYEALVSTY